MAAGDNPAVFRLLFAPKNPQLRHREVTAALLDAFGASSRLSNGGRNAA
jgi:hypothetical protein